MQQFSSLLSWRLFAAQHVSGVFPPIIRSSMTAVAASGFTFVSWWQPWCVRGRAGPITNTARFIFRVQCTRKIKFLHFSCMCYRVKVYVRVCARIHTEWNRPVQSLTRMAEYGLYLSVLHDNDMTLQAVTAVTLEHSWQLCVRNFRI